MNTGSGTSRGDRMRMSIGGASSAGEIVRPGGRIAAVSKRPRCRSARTVRTQPVVVTRVVVVGAVVTGAVVVVTGGRATRSRSPGSDRSIGGVSTPPWIAGRGEHRVELSLTAGEPVAADDVRVR